MGDKKTQPDTRPMTNLAQKLHFGKKNYFKICVYQKKVVILCP
jgi:hypothetical protein